MKKFILIAFTLFMSACAAKLIAPTQADADRAAQKFPGATLADLNEGKALFETKCTQCHGLKKPSSKTEKEWRELVPAMAEGAKKEKKEIIDERMQSQILKYVITYSKPG